MNKIQKSFDAWSKPITGGSCEFALSSHGKAFEAGWNAAIEACAKVGKDLTLINPRSDDFAKGWKTAIKDYRDFILAESDHA